jgi:predicted nucleic acid-binding protein
MLRTYARRFEVEDLASVLYTEDMQHGQKIENLIINNPFR